MISLTLLAYYLHGIRQPFDAAGTPGMGKALVLGGCCPDSIMASAGPTRIGQDAQTFDRLIMSKGKEPPLDISVRVTTADLVKTRNDVENVSAIRRAFLCLLATRNPVHLVNDGPLDLVNGGISDFGSNEKHHIFPKAYLNREGPDGGEIHVLPNFCFFLQNSTSASWTAIRRSIFPNCSARTLISRKAAGTHLLPLGPESGIPDNDYPKFLRMRGELILEEIGRLCGEVTTPQQEERQQAIEQFERRLRDCIDRVLTEHVGGKDWKCNVPPDRAGQRREWRIQEAWAKYPDLRRMISPRTGPSWIT